MTTFVTAPEHGHLVESAITTPIGELILTGDGQLLTRLKLPDPDGTSRAGELTRPKSSPLAAVAQLEEYFAGERRHFDLDLAPSGTAFQLQVWAALLSVDYATTVSYGEIAHRIGNERASRAVGMANNRNPIALIVPCHRVIGANGALVGYSGGLSTKEYLLALEQKFEATAAR